MTRHPSACVCEGEECTSNEPRNIAARAAHRNNTAATLQPYTNTGFPSGRESQTSETTTGPMNALIHRNAKGFINTLLHLTTVCSSLTSFPLHPAPSPSHTRHLISSPLRVRDGVLRASDASRTPNIGAVPPSSGLVIARKYRRRGRFQSTQ